MRIAVQFLAGLLFGLGLVVSGMADPAKVLNFLDIAGTWDPSLAFVLAGAAIFGVGWGLAGFCPGPAVTSLALGAPGTLAFVPAMLVGIVAARALAAAPFLQPKTR